MATDQTPITDLSSADLNSMNNDAVIVITRNSQQRGIIRAGGLAAAFAGAALWTLPILAIPACLVAVAALWRTTQINASIQTAEDTLREVRVEEVRRRMIKDLVQSGDLHPDAAIRLIPGLKDSFQGAAPAWDVGTVQEVKQTLNARRAGP